MKDTFVAVLAYIFSFAVYADQAQDSYQLSLREKFLQGSFKDADVSSLAGSTWRCSTVANAKLKDSYFITFRKTDEGQLALSGVMYEYMPISHVQNGSMLFFANVSNRSKILAMRQANPKELVIEVSEHFVPESEGKKIDLLPVAWMTEQANMGRGLLSTLVNGVAAIIGRPKVISLQDYRLCQRSNLF
ncbi:MAG: hypothetical protein AB7N80_07510 [Bdellovibrionales bacterium]